MLVAAAAAQTPARITIEAGGAININVGGLLRVGAPRSDAAPPPPPSDATISFLGKSGFASASELYAATEINLADTGLTDPECKAAAQMLALGGSAVVATTLNLSDNDVGVDCAYALANAISAGALPNLNSLILTNTQMGDAGVRAIVDAPYDGAVSSRRLQESTSVDPPTFEWSADLPSPPAFTRLFELHVGRVQIDNASAIVSALAGSNPAAPCPTMAPAHSL